MDQNMLLLMTACIQIPEINLSLHDIYRSDINVRLNDYKIALEKWLHHADDRIKGIIFVENSGFDLSELKEVALNQNKYNRQIEFLQLIASEIPLNVHYGYAELEMIDYTLENSKLMLQAEYMIKVTGRLYFPGVSRLVNRLKNKLFVADSRDYELLNKKKHYLLTTLFIANISFYRETLYNTRHLMAHMHNDHAETLYYSYIKPLYIKNPKKYMLRFPFNVEPVGIGAHLNVNYRSGKKRLESILRNLARRVLPFFWV